MKTNARKFLSLLLSFLMVFGSVATLLPTTVIAAEADATAGFTGNYVVYSAEDIVEQSLAKTNGNFEVKGLVEATDANNYTANYVRFAPKAAKVDGTTTSASSDRVFVYIPEGEEPKYANPHVEGDVNDYNYIVVGYKTNITTANNALNFVYTVPGGSFSNNKVEPLCYNTFDNRVSTNTTTKLQVATKKLDATQTETTAEPYLDYIRFLPTATDAIVYTSDMFFDIEYVAFFEKEADATAFDYVEYNKKTVVVKSADGTELVNAKYSPCTTVDLFDEIGLPYVNSKGEFLTLVAEGNVYSATEYKVTDDATLTVKYFAVNVYDAATINGFTNTGAGQLSQVNHTLEDGYYKIMPDDGADHTSASYVDIAMNDSSVNTAKTPVFAMVYQSNIQATQTYKDLPATGIVTQDGKTVNYFSVLGDSAVNWNTGKDELVVVSSATRTSGNPAGYTFADTVTPVTKLAKIRVLPWNHAGQSGNGYNGKKATQMTAGDYFAIKYIALHETTAAASTFDLAAYQNSIANDRFVTLNTENDTEHSVTYVVNGNEFTFPTYEVTGDNVFGGWKATNGTTYQAGDKVTVTENVTYTAIVSVPVTVTLKGTNGETVATKSVVPGTTLDLSTVAGLPYRNTDGDFLVWTDGTNIYSDTYEVTDTITLTAQYEAVVGLFTSTDFSRDGAFAKLNGTGGWNTDRLEIINGDQYYVMEKNAAGGSYHFKAMYTEPYATADYKYVVLDFIRNTNQGSLGTFIRPCFQETVANGTGYYGTKIDANSSYSVTTQVGTDYYNTLIYEIPSGYTYDSVYGLDIAPWAGQSVNAGNYFKMRYAASFASVEAAQAFDYGKYTRYTVTITDGETTKTFNQKSGTTIDVCEEFDLPYINKDGQFLALVDENGNYASATYTVAADASYTVEYVAVEVITPDIIASNSNPLTYNFMGTSGLTVNGGLSADGSYYRLFPISKGSHIVAYNFAAARAKADLGAVRYSVAYSWVTGASPWVYFGTTKVPYSYNTTAGADGLYHHDIIASSETVTEDTIANVRLVPWGSDIWQKGSAYPLDDVYLDINYIALFANVATATAFDYDAYVDFTDNYAYVNVLDADGSLISSDIYELGAEFTLPEYEAPEGKIFGGWKTADDTTYEIGEKVTVNGNITFTAICGDGVKLTVKGENGAEDTVYTVASGATVELPGTITQVAKKMTKKYFTDESGNKYFDSITVTEDTVLTTAYENIVVKAYSALGDTATSFVDSRVKNQAYSFTKSGLLEDTENNTSYYRFTPGTEGNAKAQLHFKFYNDATIGVPDYATYKYAALHYRTNVNKNWKPAFSSDSGYDDGTSYGYSGPAYTVTADGNWATSVLAPAAADISNGTNFQCAMLNYYGGAVTPTEGEYFDVAYIAFFPSEEYIEYFDIDEYVNGFEPVEITVDNGLGDVKTFNAAKDKIIPVEDLTLQYVEDGVLMALKAWKIGGVEYPADEYIVTTPITATAVYAPAYILSEADGTLVGSAQDTATVNNPVTGVEDGVYFERFTSVAGKTTVAQSQVQFADNSKTKLYAEVPYVAFSYRTNIAAPGNTWYTAYTVNNWSAVDSGNEDDPSTPGDESKYYGTAIFQQQVAGIVSDGNWNLAVAKPSEFGDYPNLDKYADANMALTDFRVAPWKNTAGIELTGNEYIDIQYIGFFPSASGANAFVIADYLEDIKIDVTVNIDGVEDETLSGKYFEGGAIALPECNEENFVGYVQDGTFVTSAKANAATVEITKVYRNTVVGDYVNERGNLANLKDKTNLTVVYIGGSVTAGAGASSDATNWAGRTTQTLEDMGFNVTAYNEGIGGTGSRLGSFRVAGDVIAHSPDLVFIDFAINDAYCGELVGEVYNGKYYEYIIREIRSALPNTEIVSVFTTDATRVKVGGLNLAADPIAAAQDEIADHYNVTSIDVGKYAAEAIFGAEGTYSTELWAPYFAKKSDGDVDGVHPCDYGYALYAEVIASYLAGIDEAAGEAAEYELPETAVYEKALTYIPSIIDFADVTYSEDVWSIAGHKWSSTFTQHLAPVDYTAESQTISFTFTGTELAIYYSSPKNADSTIAVTVDGVTVTVGGRDSTNGPKVFFENLDNVEHEVTVVQSGVTGSGYIIGILAGGEEAPAPEYTIELTASVGGEVSYNGGEAGTSFIITAKEGDKITLNATPEEGNYLRAWHDLTTGQIVVLSTDVEYVYTVTGDALINANFVPNDVKAPVKLVTFIDRGNQGTITYQGDDLTYISDYVSASEPTTLTAKANDGYAEGYWIRIAQDSDVEVFVAAGAVAGVYALGDYVFYQPVFLETDETVDLYISASTNEILSKGTAPEGYTYGAKDLCSTSNVNVFVCTKDITAGAENALEVYDVNGVIVKEAKNPAYASEWIISTGRTNTKWMMSINGGAAFVASYEQTFKFNYMFEEGTEVIITETALGEEEEAGIIVKTVASWNNADNTRTYFSGLFGLTDGLTLVNHGVMMSKNAEDLTSLVGNETGEIAVADGTIVGRISDNSETATAHFAVIKGLAETDDVWYGRAFLVYTDGTNTYLVYADAAETISATPAV